jgi:enediyne biosynthesis protein E4
MDATVVFPALVPGGRGWKDAFGTMVRSTRRGFVRGAAALTASVACRSSAWGSCFLRGLGEQAARAGSPGAAGSAASAAGKAPIVFEDRLRSSRIDFVLRNSVSPQRSTIETMTGGVALFDAHNDGLLDIFFTNGAAIPSLEKSSAAYSNRLFRNHGDGTFTDVTERAGVQGVGYSMGVAAGDYDNDGFVDLFVAGFNRNQLLHNNGDGTFTDVTEKAGVGGMTPKAGKAWSVTAGWFDYNNDGLLDLLVINYLNYDLATAAHCATGGNPDYCSPVQFLGTANILYRNNGDGTFTDVSRESRIAEFVGKGMGVSFADYDGDGFVDVFISNDTFQNYLLHNNGDGTFSEVGVEAGVAYNGFGNAVAGMGTDFRDIDNDGRPDIFQTSMFGEGFPLFRNLGGGQFQDVSSGAGLTAGTSRLTAWGTGVYDFDNDGWKDLFTANADILDNAMVVAHRPYGLPNAVFRNLGSVGGTLRFADVSATAGAGFLAVAAHRGAAFGDLNNDGRIDAVVTVLNGAPQILMNRTAGGEHWILLKLVGVQSNRDGLGTKVKVTTARGTQWNHATTAVGYNSSSDKRVHFGLGDAAVIEEIELRWPSGIRQVLRDVKADQVLTVTESGSSRG